MAKRQSINIDSLGNLSTSNFNCTCTFLKWSKKKEEWKNLSLLQKVHRLIKSIVNYLEFRESILNSILKEVAVELQKFKYFYCCQFV